MSMVWKEWGIKRIDELRDNLFLFHFNTKEDWELIISNGPWNFYNKLLLLRRMGKGETPSEISFEAVQIWVQIYDLPVPSMTRRMGEKIGEMFGTTHEIRTDKDGYGIGSCLRIRVELRIDKPLLRRAKIHVGMDEYKWVYFKYERLPTFCHVCGLLGHQDKECHEAMKQRKEKGEANIQYGSWLRATQSIREVKTQDEAVSPKSKEWNSKSRGEAPNNRKREEGSVAIFRPNSGNKSSEITGKDSVVISHADVSVPNRYTFRDGDKAGISIDVLAPKTGDSLSPSKKSFNGLDSAQIEWVNQEAGELNNASKRSTLVGCEPTKLHQTNPMELECSEGPTNPSLAEIPRGDQDSQPDGGILGMSNIAHLAVESPPVPMTGIIYRVKEEKGRKWARMTKKTELKEAESLPVGSEGKRKFTAIEAARESDLEAQIAKKRCVLEDISNVSAGAAVQPCREL